VTIMLADGMKRQAILEGSAVFLDMNSGTAKRVLEVRRRSTAGSQTPWPSSSR